MFSFSVGFVSFEEMKISRRFWNFFAFFSTIF